MICFFSLLINVPTVTAVATFIGARPETKHRLFNNEPRASGAISRLRLAGGSQPVCGTLTFMAPHPKHPQDKIPELYSTAETVN
jgi:hypothetical protein